MWASAEKTLTSLTLIDISALGISIFALIISALTFYFSHAYAGKIKMSKPNQIWFGFANPSRKAHILLKSVLYSTGAQGHIVERLYARLESNSSSQEFSSWVIGKQTDTYKPGGMRITKEGYMGDHHFIFPNDGTSYIFKTGNYSLKIFAKIAGENSDKLLREVNLNIPNHLSAELSSSKGIYFNFHSSDGNYIAELD